ncbi:MAG: hydroxymethylbilane synthase [Acidiferrobacter sp.]
MITLRLGTRKSALALWQASHVRDRLRALDPQLAVTLVPMTTEGDRQLTGPLLQAGGKALFTKELEQSLLEGRIDIAVHSMKDVVAELPPGLGIGAILEREDPRDAWISLGAAGLDDLAAGSVVGTASLRRACQLRQRRPDLTVNPLRGNVNSRLARLDRGDFSAIILAAAGLHRLGFAARINRYLDVSISLPAAAQGAIGIEYRLDDGATRARIALLNHPPTAVCVAAERAVSGALAGGCRLPVAAFAVFDGPALWVRGLVGEPDGSALIRSERRGPAAQAVALGQAVAADLRAQGAGAIVDRLLHAAP